MSGIFISYRRGDAEGQARALSIELAKYVGEQSIFMDVDSIALGRDFRQSLHDSLESCDALLALIGPHWLDSVDASGRRRLDDPADFVRQEIATALKRNIPVTPVLLQGVTMPPRDRLPDDLKDLAFRNGCELSHTRWHSDVREMMQRLGLGGEAASPYPATKWIQLPGASAQPAARRQEAPQLPAWLTRRRAIAAGAVAAAAAGTAIGFPAIRRWATKPPAPSLRQTAFDTAALDRKGAPLQTQKASAAVFTEPLTAGAGLDMVAIPGGEFIMGSPPYEPKRRANEGPQHVVKLNPFFLGASPVTQAQWAAVVMSHPEKIVRGLDPFPALFKGADLPVESIDWNEADEFCRRLAEITGRAYRLPSEAEWEYACRAGSAAPFNVGPTITTDLANYCGAGGAVCGESDGKSVASNIYDGVAYDSGAYDEGPVGIFRGKTTPAGTFPPNRFGLYDMHGNVWEYCLDVATPNYSDASPTGAANLAGSAGRILRGGSWSHNPAICRSAYRDEIAPDNPGWRGRIGLRVACTI
ncbi:MAG TPA: SUMF1/EgtB/PvdO family nonheme iron enzyme [Roseiarcus sp.]|nr:SUMF1/EgtB/PvdO family nonheme iron enzyme [Roseiarcus sp.]